MDSPFRFNGGHTGSILFLLYYIEADLFDVCAQVILLNTLGKFTKGKDNALQNQKSKLLEILSN